jgi:hypothetical protein
VLVPAVALVSLGYTILLKRPRAGRPAAAPASPAPEAPEEVPSS